MVFAGFNVDKTSAAQNGDGLSYLAIGMNNVQTHLTVHGKHRLLTSYLFPGKIWLDAKFAECETYLQWELSFNSGNVFLPHRSRHEFICELSCSFSGQRDNQ